MPDPIHVDPDDELALIQYLRGIPEVTDLVPAGHITTALDPDPVWPVVLIHDIGGYSTKDRLYIPSVQVDVFAETRHAAKHLALVVRGAVMAIANDIVPAGVLVHANEEATPQWLPDSISNPPVPRFIARYRIILHP